MGKKEGGKGGNHKGKQQLRLGGKKVAAGACIIVENYECRRPFAVFFFWLGQFRSPFSLGPRESSAKSVERMQRMHCLGTPSIGRQFHFCVGFESKGSGENADASFSLSNSLSL